MRKTPLSGTSKGTSISRSLIYRFALKPKEGKANERPIEMQEEEALEKMIVIPIVQHIVTYG